MKIAGIVFGVIFLSVSAGSAEPATVRFGVCLSLTGGFADAGQSYLVGASIRVEEFNKNADAEGFRLEMTVRDDQGDPERANAVVREFAAQEDIVAVVGPNTSDIALAVRDVAEGEKIPLISPSVTSPQFGGGGGWTFRVLFDDDFQGIALARFMRDKLGPKKAAALVNRRFLYGNNIYQAFRKVFEEKGGVIVYERAYDADLETASGMDFTGILNEVLLADPDILLLPGYPVEVTTVIRESLAVEFRNRLGLPIRFCGGDSWYRDSILLESGNNLNDSYYIGSLDEDGATPEIVNFLNLLNHSHETAAEMVSALGYDAVSLLIAALQAGHTREEVREGLYSIRNFPLVSGPITIDSERGTVKPAFIIRIRRRGEYFVRELVSIIEP